MAQAAVRVPTLDRSLSRILGLPEDIKFIREKKGLSIGQLALILGVSKTEVWHWEKGNRMPKEPLIWLSLIDWAADLRNSAS
jgi:DNA-binding transcriptional regulator YiaG